MVRPNEKKEKKMADAIFGERFVGMRKPAWHTLGHVLQEQVTAEEALTIGGITYQYVSSPIGYTLPDGTFVQTEDRVVVLREPTHDDPEWRRLGIVSNKYSFLQNEELAKGLDAIAAQTGWKFETVGALHNGATIFLTLDAGSRSVKGDEYRQFFIVSDGKASGRTLQISVAPVRVVCANTLMAAESSASMSVKIPHSSNVSDSYAFWTQIVAGLEKSRQHTFDALDRMASVRITNLQAKSIIEAAYPLPVKNAKARIAEQLKSESGMDSEVRDAALDRLAIGETSYEYWRTYAIKRREAAFTLYERFNAGNEQGGALSATVLDQVAETPYAALQAVTELADWSGAGKGASIAASALFGDRGKVKARAWDAALSFSAN